MDARQGVADREDRKARGAWRWGEGRGGVLKVQGNETVGQTGRNEDTRAQRDVAREGCLS